MWIISKIYGACNTDYLARIEVDKTAYQLYGVLADGSRIPICDDERNIDLVIRGLKSNCNYIEVA